MEEDRCPCCSCCCCCVEDVGSHRSRVKLRQKEPRLKRAVHILAVALLPLFLVTVVVLGVRGYQLPGSQSVTQPEGPPSKYAGAHLPSAMLTAPHGNITNGEYLEWESQGEEGHAHCRGFNYSNGNLVVPVNGLYRVFLQITYESKTEYHCSVNELRLTNKVYKIWDGYNVDVPLLISVDTVSCSTTQWSKSLYTEGLFSLNANTRLRVSSSCPELIVKKECQMFFGAELRYLESTSHQ